MGKQRGFGAKIVNVCECCFKHVQYWNCVEVIRTRLVSVGLFRVILAKPRISMHNSRGFRYRWRPFPKMDNTFLSIWKATNFPTLIMSIPTSISLKLHEFLTLFLLLRFCLLWFWFDFSGFLQRHRKDVSNFDRQFTSEKTDLTPTDKVFMMNLDQNEFAGFSFLNPEFVQHV